MKAAHSKFLHLISNRGCNDFFRPSLSTLTTLPCVARKLTMSGKKGTTTINETRRGISRTRILLLAFPVLLGWYVIIKRRTTTPPLPSRYAICSHVKSGPSIYTVDSNNTIIECLVISKGLIIDRGSIEDVRTNWGDSEMRGTEHTGLKSEKGEEGIKIIRIKPNQSILPGL